MCRGIRRVTSGTQPYPVILRVKLIQRPSAKGNTQHDVSSKAPTADSSRVFPAHKQPKPRPSQTFMFPKTACPFKRSSVFPLLGLPVYFQSNSCLCEDILLRKQTTTKNNPHTLKENTPSLNLIHKLYLSTFFLRASLIALLVKNLPAVQETQVRFLGWEDPLEKEMATHSSILVWKISWTEEPGGLHTMGSQEWDPT